MALERYRYKPQSRAQGFERKDIGDAGLTELRRRDQTIIDSMKLTRAQDVERRKDQIGQQKSADVLEQGVAEDIEQLKQKYFQNRLAAVKLRGRQEGQKGRDEAKFLKVKHDAELKKFDAMMKLIGAVAEPVIDKIQTDQANKRKDNNFDTVTGANFATKVEDFAKQKLWETMSNLDKARKIGGNINIASANDIIKASPFNQKGKGDGIAGALNIRVKQDITQLRLDLQKANVPINDTTITEALQVRFNTIAKAYGVLDKSGDLINNTQLHEWKKAWFREGAKTRESLIINRAVKTNTENADLYYNTFTNSGKIEDAGIYIFNHTFSLNKSNPSEVRTAADGVTSLMHRIADDQNWSTQDFVQKFANQPVFDLKTKKPTTVINKRTGQPETYAQKFQNLVTDFKDRRVQNERTWKAGEKLNSYDLDRQAYNSDVAPLITGEQSFDAEKLDSLIKKHSQLPTDGKTLITLKKMKRATRPVYDEVVRTQMIEKAAKERDFETLFDFMFNADLPAEERKKWLAQYAPLLKEMKGTNFSKIESRVRKNLRAKLDSLSTNKLTPETIEDAVRDGVVVVMEGYERAVYGKGTPGNYDESEIRAELGSQGAEDFAWEKFETWAQNLKISESSDRNNKGSAEFEQYLTGGLREVDKPGYQMSSEDFSDKVKEVGLKEAVLNGDRVVSRDHLDNAAKNVLAGKSFNPLGITLHVPGVSAQEIYQHWFDKEYGEGKIKVPEDLRSKFMKDQEFAKYKEQMLEGLRSELGLFKRVEAADKGRPEAGDPTLSPNKNATLWDELSEWSNTNYNPNGTWGVNTLIKKGLVGDALPPIEEEPVETERTTGSPLHAPGGELSPYNLDGSPKQSFNFTNPQSALSLAFAGINGLNLAGVSQVPDNYFDIIKADGDAANWMAENGEDYNWTWSLYGWVNRYE